MAMGEEKTEKAIKKLTCSPRLLASIIHVLFYIVIVICYRFANGNKSLDSQINSLPNSPYSA
jgi:hypothetical protein